MTQTKPPTTFEPCQECGSPMDAQQRYCVNCASRRGDVANPATQYFASATRARARAGRPAPAPKSSSRAAAVMFFVLLPLAVAIGVLVGQGNGDSGGGGVDEAALLKQLAANDSASAATSAADAGDATASTTGQSTASNGAVQTFTSDFSLKKGFAVSIGSVPMSSATKDAVATAKSDAERKGAKDVGLIDPTKFTVTPTPAAGAYILYSGEFKSKGEATKALSGLKKSFPKAEVISVSSATDSTGSKVVAQTEHGTLHEVTNYKPPPEKVKEDTELVNQIANDTGEDYLQHQEDLPDVITVGGDPEDAPPLPTGAGD